MKRYILQDGSAVVRAERGDWVRYAEALAESIPSDSEEAFRAFLSRRGVAKFTSGVAGLCGAVAHEIDAMEREEEAVTLAIETMRAQRDEARQMLSEELRRNTVLRNEVEKEVQRTADAYALNIRMRDFLRAYFIDGILRYGARTYREEAQELLSLSNL